MCAISWATTLARKTCWLRTARLWKIISSRNVTHAERRSRAMVVAHEMAHMWFGNLVTMRWWDDLWLNESFAELMGFHTADVATRFDGGWTAFCTGRKAWGYSADQKPTTHPISGTVTDNRSALMNFDGISYAKGASVLRQLMVLVGQDTFFEGVRRYLTRHAFANTSLHDFLTAIEEASGRDLTSWTETWLRTPGVSTLRVTGAAVAQEPPARFPVHRDHRIGIGRYDRVDTGGLVRRDRLDVEVSGPLTSVPALSDAADLVLLNDEDWTFAKIRFDGRSLATVVRHVRELADPLARALCWASLWDSARDGELPPRTFVEAVIAGASGEFDPAVLSTLLAQARTAAALWAGDDALLDDLASRSAVEGRGAEAASDVQLSWMKGWVASTRDTAALAALLDGAGAPAGLRVDTELRWHVVRRQAVLGAVTDDDIAAELAGDSTAAGERHAEFAWAARPEAAAKSRAWERATEDLTLSNHQTEAIATGFWQLEQVALCRSYVERYFEEITSIWEARTPQVAQTLANALYPGVVVDPDVLDRTDAFLAGELPAGLRRVVLERADDLQRAVAARRLSEGSISGH
jgi:aminopeptidase N